MSKSTGELNPSRFARCKRQVRRVYADVWSRSQWRVAENERRKTAGRTGQQNHNHWTLTDQWKSMITAVVLINAVSLPWNIAAATLVHYSRCYYHYYHTRIPLPRLHSLLFALLWTVEFCIQVFGIWNAPKPNVFAKRLIIIRVPRSLLFTAVDVFRLYTIKPCDRSSIPIVITRCFISLSIFPPSKWLNFSYQEV